MEEYLPEALLAFHKYCNDNNIYVRNFHNSVLSRDIAVYDVLISDSFNTAIQNYVRIALHIVYNKIMLAPLNLVGHYMQTWVVCNLSEFNDKAECIIHCPSKNAVSICHTNTTKAVDLYSYREKLVTYLNFVTPYYFSNLENLTKAGNLIPHYPVIFGTTLYSSYLKRDHIMVFIVDKNINNENVKNLKSHGCSVWGIVHDEKNIIYAKDFDRVIKFYGPYLFYRNAEKLVLMMLHTVTKCNFRLVREDTGAWLGKTSMDQNNVLDPGNVTPIYIARISDNPHMDYNILVYLLGKKDIISERPVNLVNPYAHMYSTFKTWVMIQPGVDITQITADLVLVGPP